MPTPNLTIGRNGHPACERVVAGRCGWEGGVLPLGWWAVSRFFSGFAAVNRSGFSPSCGSAEPAAKVPKRGSDTDSPERAVTDRLEQRIEHFLDLALLGIDPRRDSATTSSCSRPAVSGRHGSHTAAWS